MLVYRIVAVGIVFGTKFQEFNFYYIRTYQIPPPFPHDKCPPLSPPDHCPINCRMIFPFWFKQTVKQDFLLIDTHTHTDTDTHQHPIHLLIQIPQFFTNLTFNSLRKQINSKQLNYICSPHHN